MDIFLKVNGVSKAYPGEALGAVDDVSFAVGEGEIQSFVGESGSGKSTLLRMLAGLLKPDAGQITFRDEPLENPDEQLIAGHPSIRMVFQDFDLMPNMTVAENLRYPLLAYDKDYTKERVQALLTLCRIDGLAHKLPRELSGGQQQRVALARALADEPELLLMDEPFSQLDPVNKGQLVQDVLRILKAEGVALVLVTHDTKDALMMSDRVGFLEAGKLIQNEAPMALYQQPFDLTVASFFGHVNVFELPEVREFSREIAELMHTKGAVKVGVRAEHLILQNSEKEGGVEAQVERCFYQGDRYLIWARQSGGTLLGFFGNEPLRPQITVFVSFDTNEILFFYE